MKRVFAMLLAAAMMLSLAACGGSNSGTEPPSASGETEYKDTLVFCNGQDLTTMDASIGQ